ncbi:alpha/beta fold hydrolase [Jidongwangia harbinensis]|uniref:alpha/beta fold hydrolase n=1 Tax=Jidongwangia harbinensis TaxID=2878561 RepID=UPI001CD92A93|nr:alpha/beta hydrolase [Jidongwangia harbinensis]MCA2216009.1 alpha/beta hydrolase [Jidongwangia harbinensis]
MTEPTSAPSRPEPTRWQTGGVEVAYTDTGGDGEALLLMHGGGLADWCTPLAADPALRRHRVIRMVRAGYTGAQTPGGLTVADHSEHAAALLRHLGATPAHVVAHSAGSTVGLQLTIDHPALVRTLSLCEPPLVDTLAAPDDRELLRALFAPAVGTVLAATVRGDLPAAFDTFMTLVCGAGYRRVITDALGADAVEEAVHRCRYFFTDETPAVRAWTVDPAVLARLPQPVLLVQGSASPPLVHRLVTHLAGLLPHATVATVPGGDHLMPLSRPAELGRLVDDFVSRAGGPAVVEAGQRRP